ncbi:MAG: hypothetical protein N4A44_01375 [Alphaproteobacteria bacterium]|jgi:hypothetical protein|nr:hypothetical protein [Alphaproteobacteria bacterium]
MNKFFKKSLFKTSIISMLFILSFTSKSYSYDRTCENPFTPGVTLDASKFTSGGTYKVRFICESVTDSVENIEKLLKLDENNIKISLNDNNKWISVGIGNQTYRFEDDATSSGTIYDVLEDIGSFKEETKKTGSKSKSNDLDKALEAALAQVNTYEKDFVIKPRYCNRIFTPGVKLYEERFTEDADYNVKMLKCTTESFQKELRYLLPNARFACIKGDDRIECILKVNNKKIVFKSSKNKNEHKGYTIPDIIEGIAGKYSGKLDVCKPQNIDIFRYLGVSMTNPSAKYISKRCLEVAGCDEGAIDDWDGDGRTYTRLDRFGWSWNGGKNDTIFNFNKITEDCAYNKFRIDTKQGCYYYNPDARNLYKFDGEYWREDGVMLRLIDDLCAGKEEVLPTKSPETKTVYIREPVKEDPMKKFNDILAQLEKIPVKKESYYSCSKNEYANSVYLKLKGFLDEYKKFVTLTEDLDMEAISGGGDLYTGFLSDIDDEMEFCSGIGDHVAKVQTAIDKINQKNTAFCSRLDETKKKNLDSFTEGLDLIDNEAFLSEDLLFDDTSRTEFSGGYKSYNVDIHKRPNSNVGKNSAVLGAEAIKAIYIADKAYDALYECFKLTYKRAEQIAKRAAGYDTSSTSDYGYGDSKGPINYNSIAGQISKIRKGREITDVCNSIRNSLYYIGNPSFDEIPSCKVCEEGGKAEDNTKSQLESCLKAIKYTYDKQEEEKKNSQQNQSLGYQPIGYSPYGPVMMVPGSSGGRSNMPWNEPVEYYQQ